MTRERDDDGAGDPERSDEAGDPERLDGANDPERLDDPVEAVRDRMLQRLGGLRPSTRDRLLGQPWYRRWRAEIPPALYFESAETPATFLGLETDAQRHQLRSHVRELVEDAGDQERGTDAALRPEPDPDPLTGP